MWLHRFGSGLFIYTARHLQNEILEVSLLSIYPLFAVEMASLFDSLFIYLRHRVNCY